jgi:hypothetical protein
MCTSRFPVVYWSLHWSDSTWRSRGIRQGSELHPVIIQHQSGLHVMFLLKIAAGNLVLNKFILPLWAVVIKNLWPRMSLAGSAFLISEAVPFMCSWSSNWHRSPYPPGSGIANAHDALLMGASEKLSALFRPVTVHRHFLTFLLAGCFPSFPACILKHCHGTSNFLVKLELFEEIVFRVIWTVEPGPFGIVMQVRDRLIWTS